MLLSVTTHSLFTKYTVHDVNRCVKSESYSLSSLKWNSMDNNGVISYYLDKW